MNVNSKEPPFRTLPVKTMICYLHISNEVQIRVRYGLLGPDEGAVGLGLLLLPLLHPTHGLPAGTASERIQYQNHIYHKSSSDILLNSDLTHVFHSLCSILFLFYILFYEGARV